MERFQRHDSILNIGTVVTAAFLTFISFFGTAKITTTISLFYTVSEQVADLLYNSVVFLVLLFSILNVAFQFKDKAFRHWRAINLMTDFVTDIDGMLAVSSMSETEVEKQMAFVNNRYKHVVDVLPPSTDRDYFRAKKALAYKASLGRGQKKEKTAHST
jgi:hypothetical protein